MLMNAAVEIHHSLGWYLVFILVIRMFNVIIIKITKLGAKNGSLSHIKNVIDQTYGKGFVWK